MEDIYIAGTGMTRFGKQLDRTLRSLSEEAVAEALGDAGAEPDDVGFVFFSNAVAGQRCRRILGPVIAGQSRFRRTGFPPPRRQGHRCQGPGANWCAEASAPARRARDLR